MLGHKSLASSTSQNPSSAAMEFPIFPRHRLSHDTPTDESVSDAEVEMVDPEHVIRELHSLLQAHLSEGPRVRKYHSCSYTGNQWVRELRQGDSRRVRHELGVSNKVFDFLLTALKKIGLRDSKQVTLEEQLGMFLHSYVTGSSVGHISERFQRADGTVSK